MKPYPKHYRKQLCCNQERWLRRTSATKADVVITSDGVPVHRSVVTYANEQECDARLSGYQECSKEEFAPYAKALAAKEEN